MFYFKKLDFLPSKSRRYTITFNFDKKFVLKQFFLFSVALDLKRYCDGVKKNPATSDISMTFFFCFVFNWRPMSSLINTNSLQKLPNRSVFAI